MTYYETIAELAFGVRLKIGGVLVHSVDLKYTEADGWTPAPTDINTNPYSAVIQHGGHTIQIRVEGNHQTPSGVVFTRNYTITADAPFFAAYTAQLNQVAYRTKPNPGDYDYDISYDLRESPKHISLGNLSSSFDITDSLNSLWNSCTIANCYNFGGVIIADIAWWDRTYKPLRERTNGVLLRDDSTGKILIDC